MVLTRNQFAVSLWWQFLSPFSSIPSSTQRESTKGTTITISFLVPIKNKNQIQERRTRSVSSLQNHRRDPTSYRNGWKSLSLTNYMRSTEKQLGPVVLRGRVCLLTFLVKHFTTSHVDFKQVQQDSFFQGPKKEMEDWVVFFTTTSLQNVLAILWTNRVQNLSLAAQSHFLILRTTTTKFQSFQSFQPIKRKQLFRNKIRQNIPTTTYTLKTNTNLCGNNIPLVWTTVFNTGRATACCNPMEWIFLLYLWLDYMKQLVLA